MGRPKKSDEDEEARKRIKKAKKGDSLAKGHKMQLELERIDAILSGDDDAIDDLKKRARKDPIGTGLASSFGANGTLDDKDRAKLQNTRTKLLNSINIGKVRGRALVTELSRQSLGRQRASGTGTTLLGGQAKAPSIATTGTTLLRSS
jgi:hypothetical protein